MAYELRDFSDIAPQTTVASDITNVSTSITMTSGTGYPSGGASGDFMIQIESEIIRCSSRSGNTLTVSGGVSGRGQNGTAAVAHVAGTNINHVHTATNDSKEANRAVAKTIGQVTTSQDLIVADAANSFTRLAVGTNGQILQVLAGSVAWGALGTNTVGATQITDGSVGSAELASGAVIAGKIAAGGVSASNQFASGVVDSTAILNGTITGTDIANTTITNANIVDGTITNAKLATPGGSTTLLGSATVTSSQTGISAATDLASLSVPATVPASATILVTAFVPLQQKTTGGADITLAIKEGATQLSRGMSGNQAANSLSSITAYALLTPSAALHTYKLNLATSTATVDMIATATTPAYIIVQQIA